METDAAPVADTMMSDDKRQLFRVQVYNHYTIFIYIYILLIKFISILFARCLDTIIPKIKRDAAREKNSVKFLGDEIF